MESSDSTVSGTVVETHAQSAAEKNKKKTQPQKVMMQVVDFTDLMEFVNKLYQACRLHQVASSL